MNNFDKKSAPTRHTRLAKEPLLKSNLKVPFQNRFWAKGVDFLWAYVASWILYTFLHWSLGLALSFWLFTAMDSFGRGQSPGKWLLGLHSIDQRRALSLSYTQGLLRNFPFILLSWGLLISSSLISFLALLCIAVEFYFVRKLKSGVRVGDILARSRVFEYKDEHTLFIEQFLIEDEKLSIDP